MVLPLSPFYELKICFRCCLTEINYTGVSFVVLDILLQFTCTQKQAFDACIEKRLLFKMSTFSGCSICDEEFVKVFSLSISSWSLKTKYFTI